MKDQMLLWFRTDQSLLEEWAIPWLWQLVSRSQLSIIVIASAPRGSRGSRPRLAFRAG